LQRKPNDPQSRRGNDHQKVRSANRNRSQYIINNQGVTQLKKLGRAFGYIFFSFL
jgi:hypothetical protein